MGSKKIIEEQKIEQTVRNIPKDTSTVLDFIKAFENLYPEEWTPD